MHHRCFLFSACVWDQGNIQGSSIIEVGDGCISELRVKINGVGQHASETGARFKCIVSCREGTENFKQSKCPELCGKALPPRQKCFLCYSDKDHYISIRKRAIDKSLRRCLNGCKTNPVVIIGGEYRGRGSSAIHIRFPSKYMPD